ncbi:MAG: hypothetical protein JNL82_04970 [Myxococcales bacterium]|nr:hypothetical protein [Myxococcales bacterium]
MKLLRTLAVPLLVIGLAVSCGKKTPDGTTPPGETGGAGASDGGGGGGGDAGGGDAGGGGGDAGAAEGGAEGGEKPPEGPDPSKVCDAEVQDPKSLFADNVLIRLPKGVDLVEQTPFFARITSSNTMSTCDAIVSYAAVGYFDSKDPKKDLKSIRDETISNARQVSPGEVTWGDETTKNRDYAASYQIPEGPKGEPPIKGWLVLKERAGIMFWAAFETHPNAWNAVKKSFEESGKRLLITKK